ncbi:SH3 domain-containing protein [Pontibacter fetidus]|uniref:SH3 domain-containing protein n=1 Tax=Pontibacter fetidus TaxID=2700082 RepID=A0A6B2GYL8_9BACT|nr:SH3 domain-containing protein [Pontibacter fetidus]NDK56069.1 SH3 domain-containing protein [Pontibacter fetidus]
MKQLNALTRLALLVFLFAVSIPQLVLAAENYKTGDKLFVAPTSGLKIRIQPNLEAPAITTLGYTTPVTIVDDTAVAKPLQIKVSDFNEGTLLLTGHWVKVKAGNTTGFVFDGMLSKYKGLALSDYQEDAYYTATFGKPTSVTIPKTKMEQGHKVAYETVIKTYPEGLTEEVTVYDGCPNVTYTFNLSFNEAYWLISRMMIGADAVQDAKINNTGKTTTLTYYSCS